MDRIYLSIGLVACLFISFGFNAERADAKARRPKANRTTKSERSTESLPDPTHEARGGGFRGDLRGNVGMDSMKSKDAENPAPYSGFGFGAIGDYWVKASPKFFLPIGGGIRMSNLSATSNGIKVDFSMTTLRLNIEGLFAASPEFLIGGFLGIDTLLSGSYKITGTLGEDEYETDVSTSGSISSLSQNVFGLRAIYRIGDKYFIGADFGISSTSMKIGEGGSSSFSGNQINGFVGMGF